MSNTDDAAQPTVEYCYSHDEERFHGRFDSIEEAIAESSSDESEDYVGAWIGEVVDPVKYINPKWLGEHIREYIAQALVDEVGEAAECFTLTSEQEQEIGQMVIDYIIKGPGFNCYGVENIKRIEFAEFNAARTGARDDR